MDATFLISIVVRKSADFVAAVATQDGARHSVADVPSRFHDALAEAIEARGVPRKVAAEMFGVGLRTHQRRLKQAADARMSRRMTLSERIYRFVSASGTVSRATVERAFSDAPPHVLASTLRDLVKNRVLKKSGSGEAVQFDSLDLPSGMIDVDASYVLQHFLAAIVHRLGPVSLSELCPLVDEDEATVTLALRALEEDGHIMCEDDESGARWTSRENAIPKKAAPRRLATLGDHFLAVLGNLTDAVAEGQPARMSTSPRSKGTSVVFELPVGHDLVGEVHDAFDTYRRRLAAIQEHAQALPPIAPGVPTVRLSSYAGTRAHAAVPPRRPSVE